MWTETLVGLIGGMKMQNDKRLNCPFCNCGAIYEIEEPEDIVEKVPALFCNGCKMIFKVENDSPYLEDDKTFEYLKEKLHKQFNTRKPMERIVEQLEIRAGKLTEDAQRKEFKLPTNVIVKLRGKASGLLEAIDIVKGGVDNAG